MAHQKVKQPHIKRATQYILAIDQGTTGTSVLVVDSQLHVLGRVNHEFRQHFPKPGWVEHDPEEIWKSTLNAIRDCLSMSRVKPVDIAALGIANQRETTILWNRKTGKAIHKAIVWQDRRTSDFCQKLKKNGLEKKIQKKTGLVCDPYFSATKIRWLLDQVVNSDDLIFGTIDSYLVWRLTGGKSHVTDMTNASRTLLMNLKTGKWDEELLEIFKIPKNILPRIVSNSEIYGKTAGVGELPDGIPIAGMAGDQQAAMIGQACFEIGEAKCTYGTGSFILVNIGEEPKPSQHGCLTTVAYQIGDRKSYAWEGSAFIAGAAVQWLRDGLQIIEKASEVEALALQAESNDGVVFVPALTGLGAPHWRPQARGVITGITRGTTRAHIARATLEGIAFCQYDILKSMEKDLGKPLSVLKVDGGAAANNFLMQFQSDILQIKILRPHILETTALGAAFLAGLGVGLWKDMEEIRKNWKEEGRFSPTLTQEEVQGKVDQWQAALQTLLLSEKKPK